MPAWVRATLVDRRTGMRRSRLEVRSGMVTFQVPPGPYELILEADGRRSVTRRIGINDFARGDKLRLTMGLGAPASSRRAEGGGTVDVDLLAVPPKALKLLEKSGKAAGKGDQKKAIRLLEEAIEIHPQFRQAHNNLGVIHLKAGRPQQAEEAFLRALRIRPDDAMALRNLATVQLIANRYQESIGTLEKLTQVSASDPWVYSFLGESLFQLGRTEEAEKAFRRAVELDPLSDTANYRLGELAFKRGDREDALKRFEAFLSSDTDLDKSHVQELVEQLRGKSF